MPKTQRPLSPYAADAVALLGQLIRKARIERKLKAVDVTDRAGISRGLLRRIETGDSGCTIGAVFEVAAIVGVRLFDIDQTSLSKAVEIQSRNNDAAAEIGSPSTHRGQR